jgi:hypothetical protein
MVCLRAAGRGLRQLPVHPDRRARRPHRSGGRATRGRRPARRRHQDAQGRNPGTAALRLRRAPRPPGRDRLAVEVHRRRQDRRRALRPRAGRHRRRTARQPTRRRRQPAHARQPLAVTQGPRRQGAAQARRPTRPGGADAARARGQARERRPHAVGSFRVFEYARSRTCMVCITEISRPRGWRERCSSSASPVTTASAASRPRAAGGCR